MRSLAVAILLAALVLIAHAGDKKVDVSKIHGRIQFVKSFGDYKVKAVTSFPDLRVEIVESHPNAAGQWQIVDSFPASSSDEATATSFLGSLIDEFLKFKREQKKRAFTDAIARLDAALKAASSEAAPELQKSGNSSLRRPFLTSSQSLRNCRRNRPNNGDAQSDISQPTASPVSK